MSSSNANMSSTNYNTHLFFCIDEDCSNIAEPGRLCTCCAPPAPVSTPDCCPACGDTGPTMLGTEYCYPCYEYNRHGCVRHCTCDPYSSLMCPTCADEYAEPCRGCGESSQLWTDNKYCRSCYVTRYGYAFPPQPARTADELRSIIQEIEDRLQTPMTKDQKDDWIWILQNRRSDLADAEKLRS